MSAADTWAEYAEIAPREEAPPAEGPPPVIDLDEIRRQVEARAETFRAAEKPQEQPGPAAVPTFRFVGLDEMLREPRPPQWLVRGFLEAGTLGCLFGPSGSMKSFAAIDLGLCIASGMAWHGNEVPRPGPVFYIAGEGLSGLSKRIRAWLIEHDKVDDRLPFFVAAQTVQFLDAVSAEAVTLAVAALAEQHGAPALVVIDTLARCFGPGDENSTSDMSRFIAAIDQLKARLGCAVLLVHHSGLADKDRSRGSSALRAALDWEFRLEARDETRVLHCTKSKDHPEPPDLAFEPEDVGCSWADPETGREITSVVLRRVEAPGKRPKGLTGAKSRAMDALRTCCEVDGWAHIEIWREAAYRNGITPSDDQSAKRKAFGRAVAGLLESGHVETESDRYWPAGQRDKAGHVPHLSPCPERDITGHTPKGVSRLSRPGESDA